MLPQASDVALTLLSSSTITCYSVYSRHYTALRVKTALSLFRKMMERVEIAIDQVFRERPADFPGAIAEPIFEGMRDRREAGELRI